MEMATETVNHVKKGGFYQDKIGYRRCKKCHEGTFVNTSSASSLDQCRVCPEGTDQTKLANYRACFCKTNYSRINRFMECSFCFEEGVNCSFDYKFLRPGYYWNWSFPLTNMTAYAQFVTNLQTTDSSYDNSTIEYRGLMPYVQKCPNSESCLNRESHTVEALEGTCSDGYRGWLCYQCQSRYYRVLNTCRPCPDHWWAILEAVVLILLFCGVLYFLIWRSKDKRGNKGTKNEERSLADKVSSRMKIALGFYQVIGELFDSMHEINWVGPLSVVGKFLSFRNINIFELFIRPRCLKDNFVIDSKLEFKIALTLPVFVLATALLVYHICKLVMMFNKSQKPFAIQPRLNKLKSNVYSFILLLLFVTYTPTCDAIFALFPAACKSFNLYQNSTNYQNSTKTIELLRSDFDLPCDGSLYIYHISAYFATIYVITFPCTLLFVLRKYCKTTDPKPVVPYVQGEEVVCHERTRLLSDADRAAVPFWMKFLCENYKPRFWYWEIVELARKVTQTALVTLRGWDDALTILSTIGLSVLFLTLHAKFAPMKIPFEQRLQMFSLSAIFINILIVAVKIPPEYGVLISTLLILLNLIILLIITGEMALGILRFVRKKCFRNYSSGLDPILYADE
ncbi:hypothetical protein HOLleu_00473 [Holothuria leucospilota]|uniref:Uncharacterized protein n=1 Tax=Holothuria leucospilota TaxID=206669 RepID=A0A9Q1HFV5_HOLLE|nr:hypothetical protein HOLleu_00473 [Holothuria leucospilota]